MEKNHPAFLYRLCFNVFYFLRSCNAYIILIEKASRFENNQIEMNDEGSGGTIQILAIGQQAWLPDGRYSRAVCWRQLGCRKWPAIKVNLGDRSIKLNPRKRSETITMAKQFGQHYNKYGWHNKFSFWRESQI